MDDEQLLRYSRQIMLPSIDVAGQERLLGSHVLIIGLGGLGAPAAMYLAAAGVGRLTLVDHDTVDMTNLQRQIIHDTSSIGIAKTESARQRLAAINPGTAVDLIDNKLDEAELHTATEQANVVLDCTDNFASRFDINRAAFTSQTPLVSAAVVRMEGQVSVFDPREPTSPCYRCLYDESGGEAETCSENGVLAPVAGLVGTLQATETIKVLLGLGETLTGRLLIIDALTMEFRTLKLKRDPACPVCASRN